MRSKPAAAIRGAKTRRRLVSTRLLAVLVVATALVPAPVLLGAETGPEEELHAFVDRFLVLLGEGDLDAVEAMFVPEANVGVVRYRDGAWVGSTETFAEYMVRARERRGHDPEGTRFREPIDEIQVTVESDQLAFVRAETTIYRGDQKVSRPVDYFTLIRVDGEWKFLSAAYIVRRKDGD